MLESIDDAIVSGLPRQGDSAFERAIRNVPFNVQIPRSKLEALGKSGPSTPMVTDQRRHIRFRQLKRYYCYYVWLLFSNTSSNTRTGAVSCH